MENEIWIKIAGFEDYLISNLGSVKSLKFNKEKTLKNQINSDGYLHVNLSVKGKKITKSIHQLVAIAFLNFKPCGMERVVNHKNFNRKDNRLCNLEIITCRENTNQKHFKSTSKFTGVNWCKSNNKWQARIRINKKRINLGFFDCEIEASKAYENKLNLNNGK
jgi:hypothetical protein